MFHQIVYKQFLGSYAIRYSPGIIFSGNVPGLDVNFISPMDSIREADYESDLKIEEAVSLTHGGYFQGDLGVWNNIEIEFVYEPYGDDGAFEGVVRIKDQKQSYICITGYVSRLCDIENLKAFATNIFVTKNAFEYYNENDLGNSKFLQLGVKQKDEKFESKSFELAGGIYTLKVEKAWFYDDEFDEEYYSERLSYNYERDGKEEYEILVDSYSRAKLGS